MKKNFKAIAAIVMAAVITASFGTEAAFAAEHKTGEKTEEYTLISREILHMAAKTDRVAVPARVKGNDTQEFVNYMYYTQMLGHRFETEDLGWEYDYNGDLAGVTVKDRTAVAEACETNQVTEQMISERIAGLEPSLETARMLYSEIALNSEYDHTRQCYSAYDVLVNHKSICNGFSMLYAKELSGLGIENSIVHGYYNGGFHAWNVFELDGITYTADVTFAVCDKNRMWDYFQADATMTLGDGRSISNVW